MPVGSPTLTALKSEERGAGYLLHARPGRVIAFLCGAIYNGTCYAVKTYYKMRHSLGCPLA